MIKGTPELIGERREEIFLALYERKYVWWNEELVRIMEDNERPTKEQLADRLAKSIENIGQLLKLLSMNNYDMEANSREELLVSFKAAYGKSMINVRGCIEKFCHDMSEEDIQGFLYMFFPFLFGIDPYAEVTDKQRKAMKEADVEFVYQSIYEITYNCLLRLFGIR